MSLLDVLILACMVFLIVRGVFRGFVREVGSLAGIILGIWAAYLYHPEMTTFLARFFPAWKCLPLISVAVVIIAVLVVVNVAAWLLHKLFKKVFLGWADRTLGAALAVFKGVVIIYFAIFLTTLFVPSASSVIADSKLAPVVVRSYQVLVGLISPETYDTIKKKFAGHKERVASVISQKTGDPKDRHGR
jgi:membrane protein required for colicin V production